MSERELIFDATPVIYLAKVDRLSLVNRLTGRCLVPDPVYSEVVTEGLEQGYTDARRIERAAESRTFEVINAPETGLVKRLEEHPNLSRADIAVLGCAADRNGTAVMDEATGRDVAGVEGIRTRGTAFLVLSLAKQEKIDIAEAREAIDSMVDSGWYCAPDLYARIVRTLDSLSE